MLPKLEQAEYRRGYIVWLKFADGVQGEVDLESELWGELFEPLKDRSLFAAVSLDRALRTIVWPNGADFAPEFLYQRLRPDYVLKSLPESGAA